MKYLSNLTTFLKFFYAKLSLNVSVKCHSVYGTKSFVDIIRQYLYQQTEVFNKNIDNEIR